MTEEYYERHKDAIISRQLAYYRANRDKYLRYMKDYSKLYYRLHHPKKEKPPKPEKPPKAPKPPKPSKAPKPPKPPKPSKAPKPIPLDRPAPPDPSRGVFTLSFS